MRDVYGMLIDHMTLDMIVENGYFYVEGACIHAKQYFSRFSSSIVVSSLPGLWLEHSATWLSNWHLRHAGSPFNYNPKLLGYSAHIYVCVCVCVSYILHVYDIHFNVYTRIYTLPFSVRRLHVGSS